MIHLLLASRSPRRRELIRLLGYPVLLTAADVDEHSIVLADPAANAMQTALLKASAAVDGHVASTSSTSSNEEDRFIIVAADTNVALDHRILGKPSDAAEAREMLRALRDRAHQVHTGLVLVDLATNNTVKTVHTATVSMRSYSDQEIHHYIESGDPMDKAGAYAIQHPHFRPVSQMDGCYTGVMGLSLCHLIQSLRRLNVPNNADMSLIEKSHGPFPCHLFRTLQEPPNP